MPTGSTSSPLGDGVDLAAVDVDRRAGDVDREVQRAAVAIGIEQPDHRAGRAAAVVACAPTASVVERSSLPVATSVAAR